MRLKRSVKKILKITALLIIVAYLSFVILWAKEQDSYAVCKGVIVNVINADSIVFVTESGIINELKSLKLDPTGKKISKINTDEIENKLNKIDYFEDVQCFIDNKSNLVLDVKQILPVMRIFEKSKKSYYINKDGKKMKADARYHINVPIVTGNFNDNFKPTSLLPLFEYVDNDPVLNSYITMVEAKDSNNIFIIPNIDGHVVNFGRIENIESKFEKIKLMYSEVMPIKGWYSYDTISVKWDYQIVATKRDKKVATKMELDETDEPEPDIGTMSTDSEPISIENLEKAPVKNSTIEKPKTEKPKTEKPKTENKKKTSKSKANKVTKDAFSKKSP